MCACLAYVHNGTKFMLVVTNDDDNDDGNGERRCAASGCRDAHRNRRRATSTLPGSGGDVEVMLASGDGGSGGGGGSDGGAASPLSTSTRVRITNSDNRIYIFYVLTRGCLCCCWAMLMHESCPRLCVCVSMRSFGTHTHSEILWC